MAISWKPCIFPSLDAVPDLSDVQVIVTTDYAGSYDAAYSAAQAAYVQSIVSDTSAQMRGGEFLTGPNENVISADLQTRLKTITESAGAQSRAAQALPLKIVDQIRYSGSRIEIVGSLQSVHRAIHAIESAKPYLFITSAAIKLSAPAGRQGIPGEPILQAQLDIFVAIQVNGREP